MSKHTIKNLNIKIFRFKHFQSNISFLSFFRIFSDSHNIVDKSMQNTINFNDCLLLLSAMFRKKKLQFIFTVPSEWYTQIILVSMLHTRFLENNNYIEYIFRALYTVCKNMYSDFLHVEIRSLVSCMLKTGSYVARMWLVCQNLARMWLVCQKMGRMWLVCKTLGRMWLVCDSYVARMSKYGSYVKIWLVCYSYAARM